MGDSIPNFNQSNHGQYSKRSEVVPKFVSQPNFRCRGQNNKMFECSMMIIRINKLIPDTETYENDNFSFKFRSFLKKMKCSRLLLLFLSKNLRFILLFLGFTFNIYLSLPSFEKNSSFSINYTFFTLEHVPPVLMCSFSVCGTFEGGTKKGLNK